MAFDSQESKGISVTLFLFAHDKQYKMKALILSIAVVALVDSCTKTKTVYVTTTLHDTTVVTKDVIKTIVDTTDYLNLGSVQSLTGAFPLEVEFNANKIVSCSNALGSSDIELDMDDALPGSIVYVLTYVNAGASINLTYAHNTVVSLTDGSFSNPAQGENIIRFKYMGKLGTINYISAGVYFQP
jgi:hypothetical protein